jgi:valyl-tRNA synthetase
MTIYDKWILTKKNELIKSVIKSMDKYNFHNVGNELYKFIWEDFCDWYIELSKSNMTLTTKTILLDTLTDILKLLHPFMPYVTEEIYKMLPVKDSESIMISTYPEYNKKDIYKDSKELLDKVLEDIVSIRNLKATNKITKTALVNIDCNNNDILNVYTSSLKITADVITNEVPENTISCSYKSSNINITYYTEKETIDTKAVEEEIKKLSSSIARRKNLLANENYVNKAPANIVEQDRLKLKEEEEKLIHLKEQL